MSISTLSNHLLGGSPELVVLIAPRAFPIRLYGGSSLRIGPNANLTLLSRHMAVHASL